MTEPEPRAWRGPAPYDPDDVRRHQEATAERMMIEGNDGYFRFAPWDARVLAATPMLTLVAVVALATPAPTTRWSAALTGLLVALRASCVRVEETTTGLRVVNFLTAWTVAWHEVREVRTVPLDPLRPYSDVVQLRMKGGLWRRRRLTATQTANRPARSLLVAALSDRFARVGVAVNISSKNFGL